MPVARKFDHDEARRRHAAGETTAALAAEYGVTFNAVWRLVSPTGAEIGRRAVRAYLDRNRVPCEGGCGKLCLSAALSAKAAHNPDGRSLCARCRNDEKRDRLRFDDQGVLVAVRCSHLDCANGERWQPPENFSRGPRHREVREGGINGTCRACGTRARRDHRKRNSAHEKARDREYQRRRRMRHGAGSFQSEGMRGTRFNPGDGTKADHP